MTEVNLNIKSLADILRRDDGVGTKFYLIELSWLLFLKIFEQMEENEVDIVKNYQPVLLNTSYTWSAWTKNKELTDNSDKMLYFVKTELFPYLSNLENKNWKILKTIFSNLKDTHIRRWTTILDIIEKLDKIQFLTNVEDSQILSKTYEEMLAWMWSEWGWSGEYYTPRSVIKFIVNILNPSIKENKNLKVLDPFAGSGGFLVEAYKYNIENFPLSWKELKTLKQDTFIAFEKKFEAYIVWLMNLLLHWISNPHYELWNTFLKSKESFVEQYDIILTNPPFWGKESKDVYEALEWADYKTSSTEALGLQFVMSALKINWKAWVVLPAWQVMFGTWVFQKIRKDLLNRFNLKYIVFLPDGAFASVGTWIKTAILFFEKTSKTKQTTCFKLLWKYTKKQSIKFDELKPLIDFIQWKNDKLPENVLQTIINWEEIRETENTLKTYLDLLKKDKTKVEDFEKWFVQTSIFQQKQAIDKRYYKQIFDDIKKDKENIDSLLQEIQRELDAINYSFVCKFEDEEKEKQIDLDELLETTDGLLKNLYDEFWKIRQLIKDEIK